MKIPPLRNIGMKAAYSADFELMFSDKTLGRGVAADFELATSDIFVSASPEHSNVTQKKILEKQASIEWLFALQAVL